MPKKQSEHVAKKAGISHAFLHGFGRENEVGDPVVGAICRPRVARS